MLEPSLLQVHLTPIHDSLPRLALYFQADVEKASLFCVQANMSNCMIVLPARLASTRLPEKLLQKANGKSILRHTYEAASLSKLSDRVLVAVDDEKLANEVESFCGSWQFTSTECQSGTDRVAEIASSFPEIDLFVNVQSDEPEISGQTIDAVIRSLKNCPEADIATAGTPIRHLEELHDPSRVKIVLGNVMPQQTDLSSNQVGASLPKLEGLTIEGRGQGRAIYFSRSPVPHLRDGVTEQDFQRTPPIFWHHIGIYAYRRDFLMWFAKTQASTLEQLEKLEQLRAIEAGKVVQVVEVEHAAAGIDTQKDLDNFRARIARMS